MSGIVTLSRDCHIARRLPHRLALVTLSGDCHIVIGRLSYSREIVPLVGRLSTLSSDCHIDCQHCDGGFICHHCFDQWTNVYADTGADYRRGRLINALQKLLGYTGDKDSSMHIYYSFIEKHLTNRKRCTTKQNKKQKSHNVPNKTIENRAET